MQGTQTMKHWAVGNEVDTLDLIQRNDINIAIHERDTSSLRDEAEELVANKLYISISGSPQEIAEEIKSQLDQEKYALLIQDLLDLLRHFSKVSQAKKFTVMLATVHSNMCRKFHTDINDLRLLCTYTGPGTLWLTEDNINQKSITRNAGNEAIVIDESQIQQAKTGAVVILKGALYPEGDPIVHRSPTIEESGDRRLLLRIDTNSMQDFWA